MRVQQTLSESCLGYSAVDMLDLFSLECDNCGISDITGLEYASNLISLSLTHNQISGRWHPQSQTWQVDTRHSPALDTGDPDSDLALEQQPHGGRINCGVCGGTPQASLTSIASN